MIKPGICSVTFREKSPEDIVTLACGAGLAGVEWGADVHVPLGDPGNAKRIGGLTRSAGLEVAGFGSYFFAFEKEGEAPLPFEPVLEAAVALSAPVIRIWGGSLLIEKSEAYFEAVVERSRDAAEAAAAVGIKVAYEFHANTFTDTLNGALALLDAVGHPNLYTYWQPSHGSSLKQRLEEIAALNERLLNLHVFHWEFAEIPPYPRLPLAEGSELWKPCLSAADSLTDRFALLEFVHNDDPEQFRQDAETLQVWMRELR